MTDQPLDLGVIRARYESEPEGPWWVVEMAGPARSDVLALLGLADRLTAALDRVRAECNRSWAAADTCDDTERDLITRIRAAISGTSTWTCDCCGATNHDLAPPRRVDACHLCEHDRPEEPTQ